MKKYYELERDDCIKAIEDIIQKTNNLWILWQIYRMVVNVTKEDKL